MASQKRTGHSKKIKTIAGLRLSLLEWYDRSRRDLPWRRTKDPYAIWVSEIMLQQTRVAAVIERYKSFMERFPTVVALAEAPEQDVLAQWSGLGYYRRARMLHTAAKDVAANLQGALPATSAELRKLAGIGAYTSAAIASIAFDEAVAVVDGNVERVLSRLEGWESSDSAVEAAIRRRVESLASGLIDPVRPGDFNQAMMELGATVCTPRNPQCLACPWTAECKTRGEHKTPERARMTSREVACALAIRGVEATEVLLEQRPASETVMALMWQLPWLRENTVPAQEHRMTVRHAIMQVNYIVRVHAVAEAQLDLLTVPSGQRRWVPLTEAAGMALTGLTRKILFRADVLPQAGKESVVAIAPVPMLDVV
jgi:A/G-specific adenine glycosylase